jgi:hypothetical protein
MVEAKTTRLTILRVEEMAGLSIVLGGAIELWRREHA